MMKYDVCIVGGGSGGIGAALSAARSGLKVLLVEKYDMIGGTSTVGGVNIWEMSVGGTGIPYDIYCRLKQKKDAVGIYSRGRHFCEQKGFYWPNQLDKVNFPGGENVVDPTKRYIDTLRRHPDPGCDKREFGLKYWHGVPFEPKIMAETVEEMLAETGNCEIRKNTSLLQVNCNDGRILSAILSDGQGVEADYWIDCSGDGVLAIQAGAKYLRGTDPKSLFNEPGAAEEASNKLNGATLIYRVNKVDSACIEDLPEGIPAECWWTKNFPAICCNHYPSGDRNCNMLPTISGSEFASMSYDDAYHECKRRVYAHWHFIQTYFPEFQYYRLAWIAPLLGIRESNRIVCEYMLTEHDLLAGLSKQKHQDIIAVNDHAVDRHGEGGGCYEVSEPHGIPYRSLIVKGFSNLLVACRASGLSSIAASSCRLSRVMMQLGQAAGNAVSVAKEQRRKLTEINTEILRERLIEQHVQLEWPMRQQLKEYITE